MLLATQMAMASGPPGLLDTSLYRRGQLITTLSRWVSLGLGLVGLALFWSDPDTRPIPALAVGVGYGVFAGAAALWQRVRVRSRGLRVLHDVVDALAVGLGAYLTGGFSSPVWLLLYPHVVAISVRGGLRYALGMGLLDAVIVLVLGQLTGGNFAAIYAISILWCAFMGGATSSYLHAIQARLARLNEDLQSKNVQLTDSVTAHEQARGEQEAALARLSDSEQRYRRLLERIQDGVLILTERRVAYVNQVMARMAGDSPDGLIGADFRELVPPESRTDISERYRRWEESETGLADMETRLLTRQGATLLVSLRGASVDFGGRRSMIITVRDITRERRMEQEVKRHASRLAAINEIANAVNQSLTIENIFAVAAAEARRLLPFERLTIALLDPHGPAVEIMAPGTGTRGARPGLRHDEVSWAFRRPMTWTRGGDDPQPRKLNVVLADEAVAAAASLPLVSKDRVIGALCLGRLEPVPFTSEEIAILEPVASHVAIALDNARLLEAVRRRGREFESLVEIGRRIIERLEPKEVLPLVARSVNRIMGTHFCLLMLREGESLRVAAQEGLEPELVDSFRDLPIGDSLTGWVAEKGQALAVPDLLEEPRLRNADLVSRFGYRSYLCVPLRRGGETLGTLEVVTKEDRSFGPEDQDVMAAFADLTAVAIDHSRLFHETRHHLAELQAANRRLEQLDRLRQEYLRNVSHEFRTPLTVIRGYAEYLAGTGEMGASGSGSIMSVIVESCDRLIDMVDTLIEVSRVEGGVAGATLRVRPLDLRAVAASALETLRMAAQRRGIELITQLDEPLPVEGDADLLVQVVRKLVDNAFKYSGARKRVVVRGTCEGEGALLEVEDEGIGMAAEHLPRIFEKFYMVDGGLTRRIGGTGVGLYLVREILKLHGGSVTVRSEPGRGSVFSVRLPARFQGLGAEAASA
jgi:PAS domain S-box-containing protein